MYDQITLYFLIVKTEIGIYAIKISNLLFQMQFSRQLCYYLIAFPKEKIQLINEPCGMISGKCVVIIRNAI